MKNLHSQIDIFYNTKNWKNYWTKGLSDFINGNILDVGSGTGSNIPFYSKVSNTSQITCLEPDKKLFSNLRKKHKNKKKIVIKNLKLSQLKNTKKFKTIIYADVLEHIKNDFKELRLALNCLKKNGRLIILCLLTIFYLLHLIQMLDILEDIIKICLKVLKLKMLKLKNFII